MWVCELCYSLLLHCLVTESAAVSLLLSKMEAEDLTDGSYYFFLVNKKDKKSVKKLLEGKMKGTPYKIQSQTETRLPLVLQNY